MRKLNGYLSVLMIILTFLIVGCKKEENPVDAQTTDAAATLDAAESIGAALAINNGGALEQLSDIMITSGEGTLESGPTGSVFGFGNGWADVRRSYDSITGWWTVAVSRNRGDSTGLFHTRYDRIYMHRFLNSAGNFQKFYITRNNGVADTAYTVENRIVSGSGSLVRPGISRKLLSLSAEWKVTGANTSQVTVNTLPASPLVRTASDTISRVNVLRTLNNSLTLNFVNVTGPRTRGLNWHRAVSGTITGSYTATVTFRRGDEYREKVINRTISITLGGDKIKLALGGQTFLVDPETGVVTQ